MTNFCPTFPIYTLWYATDRFIVPWPLYWLAYNWRNRWLYGTLDLSFDPSSHFSGMVSAFCHAVATPLILNYKIKNIKNEELKIKNKKKALKNEEKELNIYKNPWEQNWLKPKLTISGGLHPLTLKWSENGDIKTDEDWSDVISCWILCVSPLNDGCKLFGEGVVE